MKKVVILGAGLVSKPMVRYLLEHEGIEVTVASRTISRAEALIKGNPKGRAFPWTVENKGGLEMLVQWADVVVSLLPYTYHLEVAKTCLKHQKHLVTTSYVKPQMAALDKEAKSKDLIFLNEMGLDPGIDHMSAMKIINGVKGKGGKITAFRSYCGALPAPEAADNPLKYKFGWSPKGVALAGRNSAKYLEGGETIEIPGEELFLNHHPIKIERVGQLEYYPNRDSLPYMKLYGIETTKTMFRGTLRYPGWSKLWAIISRIGYLSESVREGKKSYREFTAEVLGCKKGEIEKKLTGKYKAGEKEIDKLRWVGLLSEDEIEAERISPIDLLIDLLWKKMRYRRGERDMDILLHKIEAEYPNGNKEKHASLLLDFGLYGQETSIAQTVSLPAAIGVKMILEGKIGSRGVLIPVIKEIYEPVLEELESMGIKFKEEVKILRS